MPKSPFMSFRHDVTWSLSSAHDTKGSQEFFFSFLFMPLPSMEMKTSENKLFEDGEATDADNTLPLDVNCFEEISSLHRK